MDVNQAPELCATVTGLVLHSGPLALGLHELRSDCDEFLNALEICLDLDLVILGRFFLGNVFFYQYLMILMIFLGIDWYLSNTWVAADRHDQSSVV